MQVPIDRRKSLDHPDRPWSWTDKQWGRHCDECCRLLGVVPMWRPVKPNPDDEAMVMLDSHYGLSPIASVKYVRDMVPADYSRVNAYLPSKNQIKEIYGVNARQEEQCQRNKD